MRQPHAVLLVKRVERVRDLAADLARELYRSNSHNSGTRAMAEQIRRDANAMVRSLTRLQR